MDRRDSVLLKCPRDLIHEGLRQICQRRSLAGLYEGFDRHARNGRDLAKSLPFAIGNFGADNMVCCATRPSVSCVRITLGPRSNSVLIEKKWSAPVVWRMPSPSPAYCC